MPTAETIDALAEKIATEQSVKPQHCHELHAMTIDPDCPIWLRESLRCVWFSSRCANHDLIILALRLVAGEVRLRQARYAVAEARLLVNDAAGCKGERRSLYADKVERLFGCHPKARLQGIVQGIEFTLWNLNQPHTTNEQ